MFDHISVFIESGTPCNSCKEAIEISDNNEDRPVAFFDVEAQQNLVFHLRCCPPDLLKTMEFYQRREMAAWN